ncbi:MAG: phosphatase PAP2 family protein [Dehalococcoidia bacterium]|jgi:undecaprenyl-diphosphatase
MTHADQTVFFWINDMAGHVSWIDDIIRTLSCDLFLPVVMIIALTAVWFSGRNIEDRTRNQYGVICSLASMGIANLLVFICNAILPDQLRPFEAFPDRVNLIFYPPTDPSFPSNAAAASFGLAAGIWVYNHKLGYILSIPALIISFGRVYMGVHYPLDILGGFALAILATGIVAVAMKLGKPGIEWILRMMRRFYLA